MHKRSAFLLITLLGVLLLGSALAAPLFTDCVKEPVLLSMSPENPVAGKDELVIEYEITPYGGYELDWTDATSNDCKFSVKSTGGGLNSSPDLLKPSEITMTPISRRTIRSLRLTTDSN